MKLAKLQETKSTIRFRAKLLRPKATEKIGSWTRLTLPKNASAMLPSRGMTMVEGTINGFPFRASLEPNGKGSHWLRVSKVMHDAAGADSGDTVTWRLRGPEKNRRPLRKAIEAAAAGGGIVGGYHANRAPGLDSLDKLTQANGNPQAPGAMLASGRRRVCCFGGIKWLMKDHATSGGIWLQLPNSKNRFSPRSTSLVWRLISSCAKSAVVGI